MPTPTYPAKVSIMEYIETEKRVQLFNLYPSLRTIEKAAPHYIDYMTLDDCGMKIGIFGTTSVLLKSLDNYLKNRKGVINVRVLLMNRTTKLETKAKFRPTRFIPGELITDGKILGVNEDLFCFRNLETLWVFIQFGLEDLLKNPIISQLRDLLIQIVERRITEVLPEISKFSVPNLALRGTFSSSDIVLIFEHWLNQNIVNRKYSVIEVKNPDLIISQLVQQSSLKFRYIESTNCWIAVKENLERVIYVKTVSGEGYTVNKIALRVLPATVSDCDVD